MTTSLLLTVNIVLGLVAILAVAALARLAFRLPSSAPHSDEQWGAGGDPWVVSDPLPLRELARHEESRSVDRAA